MVATLQNNTSSHIQNLSIPQDELYFEQGVDLFHKGNYAAAWAAFDQAIKLNPHECCYFYMRGACCGKLGLFQAALKDYHTAMSLAKTNEEKGWIHFDLAMIYGLMDDETNGLFHLKKAAQLGNNLAKNVCQEAGIPY